MATELASFPNSRIKPRDARTTGQTNIQTINAGVTLNVAPQNADRTDLIIRNLDSISSVFYGYVNTIDGSPANEGFELKPLESIEIQGTQDVFIHNPNAGPVNIVTDEGSG